MLISAQGDGNQLSNTTVATSIIPAAAKLTLPANFISDPGMVLRFTLFGRISNVVTTPGTLTLDIRYGGTVIFNGGAQQLSTTAHTNVPFFWQAWLTSRTIGAAGNFMGQSIGISQAFASTAVADNTYTHASLMMPNTAPAVGSNVDLTAAAVIDVFGTFSVNTNPTNLTVHQYMLESLN